MAVGRGNARFVPLACINIVVAANAGGAFSPLGDITTLMVWQAGRVPFTDFFGLALPSLVNWLVPALLLSAAVRGHPVRSDTAQPGLEPGTIPVLGLLIENDLVDEYRLFVHPLVLGTGKRLFRQTPRPLPMRLVDCTPTTTGVLLLSYEPSVNAAGTRGA